MDKPETNKMDAMDWQYDINYVERQKRKVAYAVAAGVMVICLLLAMALAALVPLKDVVPVFVRVDNSTGQVDVLSSLKEIAITQEDALNRAFVVQYVRSREEYLYPVMKRQFEQVMVMSDGTAKAEYKKLMMTDDDPENPFKKYDEKQKRVKILSISFISDDVASVRFQARLMQAGEVIETSTHIATVIFEYGERKLREELRYLNPLDFLVTSYKVDAEAGGEG